MVYFGRIGLSERIGDSQVNFVPGAYVECLNLPIQLDSQPIHCSRQYTAPSGNLSSGRSTTQSAEAHNDVDGAYALRAVSMFSTRAHPAEKPCAARLL